MLPCYVVVSFTEVCFALLCCTLPFCAVVCCTVLSCAAQYLFLLCCCVLLFYAVLYCTTLYCTTLCYAVPGNHVPCCTIVKLYFCAVQHRYGVLRSSTLLLYCAVLCCAVLCCTMLLCSGIRCCAVQLYSDSRLNSQMFRYNISRLRGAASLPVCRPVCLLVTWRATACSRYSM